jgi:hypothetical protein
VKQKKENPQHNTKPNKGNKRERERDWYLEIQSSYGGLTVQQRERERERERTRYRGRISFFFFFNIGPDSDREVNTRTGYWGAKFTGTN